MLANWSGKDRPRLRVQLIVEDIEGTMPVWTSVSLASGRAVNTMKGAAGPVFTLTLIDGDAIILRP